MNENEQAGELVEIPRILIAGDRSSSGKTTISTGLMSALNRRGLRVQPFKVGLDYIDPSYHTEVTDRPSRNLDGHLMDRNTVLEVFHHGIRYGGGTDIAIIEGVRGLFEGLEGLTETGSTAQIAKMLDCPVVLVIDARSITRSAAAVVMGYKAFDPDVNIAGVILNNIGSVRHARKAREAIETYTGTPVIGEIHRNDSMNISMRHLGLIPAMEGRRKLDDFDRRIKGIMDIIREGVEIDTILELARSAMPMRVPVPDIFVPGATGPNPVIGVALDEAFNFYYRDNLDLLELAGARLVFFSPLIDTQPPEMDGLYIGGGYPELFAPELSANEDMREHIKEMSRADMPIYAECGGLMYLATEMITGKVRSSTYRTADMPEGEYAMVGALPGKTLMGQNRVVSYSRGGFIEKTPVGYQGDTFLGHEFHHSEIIDLPNNTRFGIKLERGIGIRDGYDGLIVKNTLGVYSHLHAASYREFGTRFVDSCVD
ncbi:MAG: Ni-sirohydrochlorin a,c-diamide synthase [ANME-2 cluster archaeon]|nr:Ni-sirohydrochlorin a,c-diamide synthase [ANME-2 cluster archaeon]